MPHHPAEAAPSSHSSSGGRPLRNSSLAKAEAAAKKVNCHDVTKRKVGWGAMHNRLQSHNKDSASDGRGALLVATHFISAQKEGCYARPIRSLSSRELSRAWQTAAFTANTTEFPA